MRRSLALGFTLVALMLPGCPGHPVLPDGSEDSGCSGDVACDGGHDSATDAVDVFDAQDAMDATDAMDGSDAADVADATDVSDATDVLDGSDASDAVDAPDASETCALTDCSGACVDTQTDVHNCGACGTDCTTLPGVVASAVHCTAGVCDVTGACMPNLAHCGSDPSTGCETDLTTAATCGSCSVACSEPTPVCAGSGGSFSCVSGCSGSTPTRCSGSCVDTQTDPNHCGGCTTVCPTPADATATCVAGVCGFTCNTGFHLCGSDCVSDTDVNSCGSLCTPCASPANGMATCVAGACGVTCDTGFHLCGSNCADDTSPSSCGASCTPCMPPSPTCSGNAVVSPTGAAMCTAGACDYMTTMTPCTTGCFDGVCTGPFVSMGGVTAARTDTGATFTLDTTSANGSSTAGGPVPSTTAVSVTEQTMPGGTVQSVDLFWSTTGDFSSGSNQVPMSVTTSTSGADTWTGVIPAQAAGTEIYFYMRATPYGGAQTYDPSGFGVHYAYAVN